MANPRIVAERDAFLIDVLSLLHPEAKRNSLRRMIDHGRVTIDGSKASRAKQEVPAGSTVETLSRTEVEGPSKKAGVPEPDVLYDDKHLMVVNKPAGLLSVRLPGASQTRCSTELSDGYPRRRPRGCIWYTVSTGDVGLPYSGQVPRGSGSPAEPVQGPHGGEDIPRRGIWEPALIVRHLDIEGEGGQDKRVRLVQKGERGGKEAITNWEVEERGPIHTLVRIKIDTGRRAQIRLHMSDLGCPVSGDTRYGRGKASVNRLCLHATSLGFDHPYGAA